MRPRLRPRASRSGPPPCPSPPTDGPAGLRHDGRVVVLGADLLDVLEPRALVRGRAALAAGVLEVPGVALVGPVVGVEPVGLPPVGDGGGVVAGGVEVLAELEVSGGGCLVHAAWARAAHHLVRGERVPTG